MKLAFTKTPFNVLGLDEVVIRRLLAVQGELQHGLFGLLRTTLPCLNPPSDKIVLW